MKRSVILFPAFLCAGMLLAGCGNTKELERTIADRQASIDSLQKENQSLRVENGRLKSRVNDLEQNFQTARDRAAQLEMRVRELENELEKAKSPAEPSGMDEAYRDALGKFMEGKYEEAIAGFSRLLAAGIPDPLNDNCVYWIGESNFGLKRYDQAIAKFQEVLAFEWSNKKDDAQIMIARSYARSGDLPRAREEYQKLIDTYPASPYKQLAVQRVGTL